VYIQSHAYWVVIRRIDGGRAVVEQREADEAEQEAFGRELLGGVEVQGRAAVRKS
jgi:hypothetical protein